MNKKLLTLDQVQKKYKGKYIEVSKNSGGLYTVYKSSNTIRENMTLAADLETSMAYRR